MVYFIKITENFKKIAKLSKNFKNVFIEKNIFSCPKLQCLD